MAQQNVNQTDEGLERDEEAEKLLDAAPWDSINTDPTLPQIAMLFKIEDVVGKMTKTSKLMLMAQAKVLQPLDYSDRNVFLTFVIGTDNDPKAQKAVTWDAGSSMGATFLSQLRVITGSKTWRDLKDKVFMGQIIHTEGENGEKYNNVVNFAKEGELSVGVPTPPRKYKAKKGPGKNLNDSAPSPDADVTCVKCGGEVPQALFAEHIVSCTGVSS